jgi:predicted acyl esterase
VQDGQPAHARVEDADGPRIHGPIVEAGAVVYAWLPVPRLRLLVAAVCAVAVAAPAHAWGFARTDVTLTMDDGVPIAATLYLPDGSPPPAGWPGIVMFHGLGGTRSQMNALAEMSFANQGYAVLTFDTRGHGASGGLWSLVGPREVADFRALYDWLAARPDVDGARIGAWGISLGGGAVWRSVVEGIPFAAVETVETWTDLTSALLPQNLSKSGVIVGLLNLVPPARTAPEIQALAPYALASTNLPALRDFAASRSTRQALATVRTPAYVFQGRRDFIFGLDQGLETYRLLAGPKRLYVGAFGHAPSTFPGPDVETVLARGSEWFARFLQGQPNGIDMRPPVEVAADPFRGAPPRAFRAVPATRALRLAFAGPRRTIAARGKIVRRSATTRGVLETFGTPVVRVTASGSFDRIVAVLTAVRPDGSQLVVSAGGVKVALSRTPRTIPIRLISQVTTVPAGSRLTLTFGASSTVADGNLLYLTGVPGGTLTVGAVTMSLPVLRTPVSRP